MRPPSQERPQSAVSGFMFDPAKSRGLFKDNSDIILEDFKENYANEPQKNNNFVSEKFIRFIA